MIWGLLNVLMFHVFGLFVFFCFF